MGNNQSNIDYENYDENEYNNTNRYNWTQSFVKYNEETLKYNENDEDEEKNYCDLRPSVNCLFNEKGNLLILSICVYLNFLLINTEKLKPFIVSYDYFAYNLKKNNNIIKNNFSNIFNLIKKIGFVSSNENIFDNDHKIREDLFELGKNYRYIINKKVDNDIRLVKRLLDKNKIVLIGLPIYTNFESNVTIGSNLNLPKENDNIIGGICGIICGYIEKNKTFIMYLGISKKIGDRGYIYISYDYIKSNYGSELWILELNEELILLNLNDKIKKAKMVEEEDNITFF